MLIIDLVHNIALLVSLAVIFDLFSVRFERNSLWYPLISGFLFGLVAVVGMMTPLRFAPGVIYDGRSIILAVAGLFSGPLGAASAALIAGAYRMYLGGAGALVGSLVIVESALLGSIFYFLRRNNKRWASLAGLILLSVLVHVCMMALQLLIPRIGIEAVFSLGPVVIPLYTLGLVLISLLFLDRERKRQQERQLFMTSYAVEHASLEIYQVRESDGRILNPNEFMCRVLGYHRDELQNLAIMEVDRSFNWDWWREHKRALAEKGYHHFETEHTRKDGSSFPVEVTVNYVSYRGETFSFAFARDVSDRKEYIRRIEASLREKELLLREIHHRVRNNFAIMTGLLGLQAEAVRTPEDAKEAFTKSRDRIQAMSEVHNLLYRSGAPEKIDLRDYVRGLTENLLSLYQHEGIIDLNISLSSLEIDMDRAIPLGLIVNEAVTNILKHAFAGEKGRVSIFLQSEGEARTLVIEDNGRGFVPGTGDEESDGLGLKLMDVLARQAGAQLSIEGSLGEGTVLRLRL